MDQAQRGILKTVIVIGIFIAIVVSAFVYKMTSPRVMTVKELVNNGAITFEEPTKLKEFELLSHTGEVINQDNFKGHWTVLFFGFTHCAGYCPTTLALLNNFYGQLEDDIREKTEIVMVTVDPARDSADVLAAYVPKFNPEFVGLTGEFLTIKLLANSLHVPLQKQAMQGENYHVQHGEQLILINPKGEFHGFFKADFTLARLKATYQSIVISY
ncbi:SCO family protein [Aurantivibrio infirmus]